MKEKQKEELDKQVFDMGISEKIASFEEFMKFYEQKRDNPLLRKKMENRVKQIVSSLDYYSLLDLQKKYPIKEVEIRKIFEERKIPLLEEVLRNILDPFELLSLLKAELVTSDSIQLIIKKINQVLINYLEKINRYDDLLNFFVFADDNSTAKQILGEKLKRCLQELSYFEILEKQKKRFVSDKALVAIFEEIKYEKVKTGFFSNDLSETAKLISNEQIGSLSQKLFQDHLAQLVEKKISQINDLKEIIKYWHLCPHNCKAQNYLETKFFQLLSNLSYRELVSLKKEKLNYNSKLSKLVEKRQIEIIPEFLETLKTMEMVKQAIVDECYESETQAYLLERLSDLVEEKINEIDKLDDLIVYYSLVDKKSLQNKLYEKIEKKVLVLNNLSELLSAYAVALYRYPVDKLIKARILLILEENKKDKVLIEGFLQEVKDEKSIPSELSQEIENFLKDVHF